MKACATVQLPVAIELGHSVDRHELAQEGVPDQFTLVQNISKLDGIVDIRNDRESGPCTYQLHAHPLLPT
eukprot:SAG11_NODE_6265_length_1348_cov_1.341873_2_plen_70_part_00